MDDHQRRGGDPRRAVTVHRDHVQPVRRAWSAKPDEGVSRRQLGEGLLAAGGQLLRHHRRPAHAQRRLLSGSHEQPGTRHRHRHGGSVLPRQRRCIALHRARPRGPSGAVDGSGHGSTGGCRSGVARRSRGVLRRAFTKGGRRRSSIAVEAGVEAVPGPRSIHTRCVQPTPRRLDGGGRDVRAIGGRHRSRRRRPEHHHRSV